MKLKQISISIIVIMQVILLGYKSAYAEELEGKKYEKFKKESKVDITKISKDVPKEVKEDYKAVGDIKYLKKMTDKEYEIALAHNNGDYTYVKSTNSLNEAVKDVERTKTKKGAIPTVLKSGQVVYSAQSIGRIARTNNGSADINNVIVNVYPTANSNSAFTYINHGYIDDVPIIEDNGRRVKVMINGYLGWIDKTDKNGTNIFQVPLNQAVNLSYYKKSSDGTLQHYISSDVTSVGDGYTINVGKAPNYINHNKKYYSYDGIYFYNSINELLVDYGDNKHSKAINSNDPYYNYYTYIPGRSKTAYTVDELNKYLNNNTPNGSVLRNKGQAFIDAQNKYGVNAAIILGVAMNESGRGTSNIAKTKNNIFGLNAVDSDTGQANTFVSVDSCIKDFAKNWMSNGYMNPKDWRYNGSSLGNKGFGINVKYASDPFWGEKAANYAYSTDKYLSGAKNLKDYNQYILGIYTSTNCVKDYYGNILYNINSSRNKSGKIGDIVLINKKEGNQYNINADRQVGLSANSYPEYNWNKNGYISANGVGIISNTGGKWEKINGKWYRYDKNGNKLTGWNKVDGKWYFMNYSSGIMEKGWIKLNNKYYYLNTNGEMEIGWTKIDGQWNYFDKDGEMQEGWVFIDKNWYFFEYSSGKMLKGWLEVGEEWYYANTSGEISRGWEYIDNKWYHFDNIKNNMLKGWQFIDNEWYFMDNSDGFMHKGWIKLNNKYYYLDTEGNATKGWSRIGGEWYYFNSSNEMVTNTTIDGWIIGDDGIAKK